MQILSAPPPRSDRPPNLAFLVWVAISGSFPIHVFVPALPQLMQDLGISVGSAQLTVTAYMLGLALGQLFIGPLSDRFGRRPVLLIGLALFLAATLASAFATTIGALGWRAIFLLHAVTIAALLAIAVLTLPETFPGRRLQEIRALVAGYLKLAAAPGFLRWAVGGAFATSGFFAFVAAAPFLLSQRYGMTVDTIGLLFMAVVGALTTGSLAASRLARRFLGGQVLKAAAATMLAATLALALTHGLGQLRLPALVAPVMAMTFSSGLAIPFAMASATNYDPMRIGAASGLYGCAQMTAGALVVSLVGALPLELTTALILLQVASSTIACMCCPAGRAAPAACRAPAR